MDARAVVDLIQAAFLFFKHRIFGTLAGIGLNVVIVLVTECQRFFLRQVNLGGHHGLLVGKHGHQHRVFAVVGHAAAVEPLIVLRQLLLIHFQVAGNVRQFAARPTRIFQQRQRGAVGARRSNVFKRDTVRQVFEYVPVRATVNVHARGATFTRINQVFGSAHARIIRQQRVNPVVEKEIIAFQVAGGGTCRGHNVLAFVHVAVYGQTHFQGGFALELPETHRIRRRNRIRNQAAFLHHQVFEIVGQAFFGQYPLNDGEVQLDAFNLGLPRLAHLCQFFHVFRNFPPCFALDFQPDARKIQVVGNIGGGNGKAGEEEEAEAGKEVFHVREILFSEITESGLFQSLLPVILSQRQRYERYFVRGRFCGFFAAHKIRASVHGSPVRPAAILLRGLWIEK